MSVRFDIEDRGTLMEVCYGSKVDDCGIALMWSYSDRNRKSFK